MNWPFPRAAYINTDDALLNLIDTLATEPLLAIDTESNSLHAYRERVCLIQLSTRSADYIIDPLTIADLQPLGPLLANPAIEKVFHAAEYDLICLKRDFDFTVMNLFDTMIAARITGHKQVGLGSLLQKYAGVENDKRHQRDDWGQRPLPDDSLLYAQMDTHYLPMLRDRLGEAITAIDRWPEAREAFQEACDVVVSSIEFDPEGYWRIGLPNRLARREMAILRELYLMREQIAQKRDQPPFKVFSDKTLIQTAQIGPVTTTDLFGIDGMSPAQIRRYGQEILRAVARADKATLPPPPARRPAADPDVVNCYSILREWRKARAEERGVESDVIISKDALWMVAERTPKTLDEMRDIPGIGPWRLEAYGQALLDLVRQCQNQNGRG